MQYGGEPAMLRKITCPINDCYEMHICIHVIHGGYIIRSILSYRLEAYIITAFVQAMHSLGA